MPRQDESGTRAPAGGPWFATTHWSVVLNAAQGEQPGAREALETLCSKYWEPLFAYVRRKGYGVEDAQDLTQQFMVRLLQDDRLSMADPGRGRFRSFLLSSMKNFLINEWEKRTREKRGGGFEFVSLQSESSEVTQASELSDARTPEVVYEERWAATIMSMTMKKLQEEHRGKREQWFEQLKGLIWGGSPGASHAELAIALGSTEGALRVAVHRLRSRYRELLREEIAQTVQNPAEVDDELRYLVEVVFRRGL